MAFWRFVAPVWWSAALLLFYLTGALPAVAEGTAAISAGELLVSLRCGSTCGPAVEAVAATVGTLVEAEPWLGVCRLRLRPELSMADALARLRANPLVRYVEPNPILTVAAMPNDPNLGSQYGPRQVQADLAWQIWNPRVPVVIAVIDSGIDSTHPDLTDKILRDEHGIVGYNAFIGARGAAMDDYYHGTHVAGIAAARTNNGTGIAGIAGFLTAPWESDADYIKLMPVKALDRNGRGSAFTISRAIRWAADSGANILNLSLGSSIFTATLSEAVRYAQSKGCLLVAAAGNAGTSSQTYPASLTGVIGVAATDREDRLTFYSTHGPWVHVAAPGDQIVSTTPTYGTLRGIGAYYGTASGTSMACPHVAGEAALLLSQNPNLTASDVAQLILTHVDPYLPYQSRTLALGGGRINVFRALRAASTAAPTNGWTFLSGVSVSSNEVVGGASVMGRVTLRGRVPTEEIVVRLSTSNDAVASVPETLTIPAGSLSAEFPILTHVPTRETRVEVIARYAGGTRTAALLVKLPAGFVTDLTLTPTAALGGSPVRGTVRLSAPAPREGVVVELSSHDPSIASVPASVRVPYGQSVGQFTITTRAVAYLSEVGITAATGIAAETATLTIQPPGIRSLVLRPSVVRGPRALTGTITLEGPAPEGGLPVRLTSGDPDLVSVPTEVSVPAGAVSVTFSIDVGHSSESLRVPITAAVNGTSFESLLRVLGL